MNIPSLALKNLERKVTRTWLLLAIVAVVSGTLFTATLFLKSINNALKLGTYRLGADILVVPASAETRAKAALLSGEPTQFLMDKSVLDPPLPEAPLSVPLIVRADHPDSRSDIPLHPDRTALGLTAGACHRQDRAL